MELIPRITLKILAAGLFVLSTTPAQAQFQVTVPNMTIVDGGVNDRDNKPNAIGFGNWPPSNPPINPPIVINVVGGQLSVSGHAIQEFKNGHISEVRFDYLNIIHLEGAILEPKLTSSITVQSGIFAAGGPPFFGRVHLAGKYSNVVKGRNLQNAQVSLTGSVLMPAPPMDIGTIAVPASGQNAPNMKGGKPQQFGPGTTLPTKDVGVKLGVAVSQLMQTLDFTLGDGDQIVSVGSTFTAGYTADTIFTVNSPEDLPTGTHPPNVHVCDTGSITTGTYPSNKCTLRAALTESNMLSATSAIQFNIPGVPRITVDNTVPGNEGNLNATNVIIDGTTQPGVGLVELDGSKASLMSAGDTIVGLNLDGENSTVLGMVINGFKSHAIQLRPTSGPIGTNVIEENLIGTDTTGQIAIPNAGDGIHITQMPNNSIRDNIIANNAGQGVSVDGSAATGNSIQANPISANGGGISLTGGANNMQSAPVLSSATEDGSNLAIGGVLHGTPNLTFSLDIFVNSQCDSSGSGQGQTHLGSTIAATDANGNASFTAILPADPSEGLIATATATDALGNTSQFSACAKIQQVPPTTQPPVANAGSNQTVSTGTLVTLNGSGSSDPNSPPLPLTFLWKQTAGPAVTITGANTATPSFTPTQVGTYVFSLVVNNGVADSPASNVTITVITPALEVQVTSSGLLYSRVTRTFNGTVTVTNIGGSAIPGPIHVGFADLPATVALANATTVVGGIPFITLSNGLAPGQSASFTVQFSNPSNVNIHYSPVVN